MLARGASQKFEKSRNLSASSVELVFGYDVPKRIAAGQADVGIVLASRITKTPSEIESEIQRVPLGKYVACFLVHAKSNVKSLTREQLCDIFVGKEGSWKAIPTAGSDAKIDLYSLIIPTPAGCIVASEILPGKRFSRELDMRARPPRWGRSSDEVQGMVITHPNAIAFCQYEAGTAMDKRVRIVGVTGDSDEAPVFPTIESVAKGDYTLQDTMVICIHRNADPLVKDFVKFLSGQDGVEIVRHSGYWPEYELQRMLGKQRLAELKAGKGAKVSACGPGVGEGFFKEFASKFTEAKATVQVKYLKKDTASDAAGRLLGGEAEVMLLDHEPTSDLAVKLDKCKKHINVGRQAVGVIVHPENLVASLPMKELRQICGGEVKSWPSADGPGRAIRGYGLQPNDPAMKMFGEMVGGNVAQPPSAVREGKQPRQDGTNSRDQQPRRAGTVPHGSSPLKFAAQADTAKVVLAVARDKDGIGVVDLSQMPSDDKSVKLIRIFADQGQDPDDPAALAVFAVSTLPEDYPLARRWTLWVAPQSGKEAQEMVDWLEGNPNAELLAANRLLPVAVKRKTQSAIAPVPRTLPGEPQNPAAPGTPAATDPDIPPLILDEPEQ